jgi:hypothetical protein
MNKIRCTPLGVTSTNYSVTVTNLVLATTKESNLILLNCFLSGKLGWKQLEQELINNNNK